MRRVGRKYVKPLSERALHRQLMHAQRNGLDCAPMLQALLDQRSLFVSPGYTLKPRFIIQEKKR